MHINEREETIQLLLSLVVLQNIPVYQWLPMTLFAHLSYKEKNKEYVVIKLN